MGSGPAWKREIVPDHKFDFVDTREFTDKGFTMRMKYFWLYIVILKSFLVYISDIFTAITMLTTTTWTNSIFKTCPQSQTNGCVFIPFSIGKWIFFGCIVFSFLLLGYEARKSKRIIASRDISYAFTNIMANNYYSLRSYDHFCFFDHISNSTKKKDDFAFFIFFTFKSWKRLLLADGARQSINALTLYSIYLSKEKEGPWYDLSKYSDNIVTTALITSTTFTVAIFAGSLLLLIVAGICYVPLLCYIQGNLKEYCCHKVDKRISEVIKRRNKQRLAKAAEQAKKEAKGDFSHLKNKKGELIHNPLPQPTLPNVSLDDDEFDDGSSMRTRGPPQSTYTGSATLYTEYSYASDYKGTASNYAQNYGASADYMDYPPMPSYAQGYSEYSSSYGQSVATLPGEQQMYDEDEYASSAHLAHSAAPFAQQRDPSPNAYGSSLPNPYHVDPLRVAYAPGYTHSSHEGLNYEGSQDYPNASNNTPAASFAGEMYAQQDQSAYHEPYYGGDRGGVYGYDAGGYDHGMR